MKLVANIVNSNEDNIKWLLKESDENDTKGFFLYYHLDENNAFDTWHQTLDEAYEAGMPYGIDRNSWKEIK
jgi:hypothetical protein